MMKRVVSILIVIVSLLCMSLVGHAEEGFVQIVIDGQILDLAPGAKLIDGSTYVPLKSFVQSFAYKAEVQETNIISGSEIVINYKKNKRVIKLNLSQGFIREININGIMRKTNVKAIYQNGQVWVPIVFIVHYLGGQVTWSESTQRVMVESYKPVIIRDSKLNKLVRSSIGILDGDLLKCDLELINVLSASNKGIADLEGIQYLSNLVQLDLSNNMIKDIAPLRQLTKLNTLYLKGNQIDDYSPLAAIYNQLSIRDFNMSIGVYDKKLETEIRMKIGKLSGALTHEDMQKITELDLSNKGIADLQGIQFLTNLRKLNLTGNNIRNISYLKNLILLEELTLNENKVDDIKALSSLTNLEQLDLLGNQISDLSPLANLAKLKQLSVMDNKVNDISSLRNLMNLEILVLQNNGISNISDLGKLVNLKELYLGNNKIRDISMLSNLINLEILNLKSNQISDVSSLKYMFYLKELYLSANPVTNYSVLMDLATKLKVRDFLLDITVLKFYIDKSTYNINNEEKQMDIVPMIKGGRTFLPVKYVAEALGANVIWDDVNKRITVLLGNDKIEMVLGDNKALVNSEERIMDVAPFVENGRTLVPLRFLSESLGCTVDWNPDLRSATLY